MGPCCGSLKGPTAVIMKFAPVSNNRRRAGYTLAETLAALLFLAIVIPAVVEALHVGCRLTGYEPVLTWLQKAHQRQGLSLAALQQRFRLPPHRPHSPQRISQHHLESYDDLLVLRPAAPGGGSRPADPDAAAAAGMDPLPLAEPRCAG